MLLFRESVLVWSRLGLQVGSPGTQGCGLVNTRGGWLVVDSCSIPGVDSDLLYLTCNPSTSMVSGPHW